MSEVILYACASALLCGLVPSFMKTGVRRAAPSVAAALYATVAVLFAFGAAAISGTLGSLLHIDNAALLNLALDGLLDALVWLCLFTALSTGGVNRVMPIHNLAAAGAIGVSMAIKTTLPGSASGAGVLVSRGSASAFAPTGISLGALVAASEVGTADAPV